MQPDAIVACRYGGGVAHCIIEIAERRRIPLIFHIDDNLLSVPPELGPSKLKKYSAPERKRALTELLTKSSLVYGSTAPLVDQLMNLGIKPKASFVGEIAGAADASGTTGRIDDNSIKIGYMASSSHSHDLEPLVPILSRILDEVPNASFELFGTVTAPPVLAGRIAAHHPAIRDYDKFIGRLAELHWDIGLAPLRLTSFNLAKTNTKWIEYTAAGVPVICSRHPVYAEVCAAKGAVDADSPDEWDRTLRLLIQDRARRIELRQAATALLCARYSVSSLTRQVARVLSMAGLLKKSALLVNLCTDEAKEADG
jgi:glycosyltransferase involved in cell wall biosynthesis